MSALLCIIAFLFGSIPWGYLIGKAKGIDLRKTGSGNIGATNVMRVIGKKQALITLLLDISKGFIPVLIFKIAITSDPVLLGMAGISAVLGHCFTPFLKFKGGKGVATSIGVLLAYMPLAGFITVFIWIITVKISKISSLGALVCFALLPLNVIIINYPKEFLVFAWLFTILIYSRHISNIKRLIKGTEPRIGENK
ncbi:MAG: glycerol-3-phosphate 1-O-acyltransferase PlsY [Thermodesulfovibrio sp.]|uniref:Glycerol-3-phosphate acyltransferase n=1 Tax=Thermodesulfovibrio aggregans TaxID=86166 RepID=A0A2J6WGF6_9BACT|nr:MAG: acyl-phosphate glycerol 3-phosphate acyltransferase [Thermodesulfovibrio aggregans]